MEAEHRHQVWLAWHQAAFTRMKRLPPLKTFLKKKESNKIDEDDIKTRLILYQSRLEDDERSEAFGRSNA